MLGTSNTRRTIKRAQRQRHIFTHLMNICLADKRTHIAIMEAYALRKPLCRHCQVHRRI